jgi:thiol-disulfide isomerase/thioredoxin
MKKLFSLAVALLVVMGAMAQKEKTITIDGNVKGDLKGYDYIYYYANGVAVDSTIIKDGKFKIVLPFKETYTQLFYTQYEVKIRRMIRPFPLLIDGPGKITIDMNIEDGFHGSKVSGMPTTILYNSFLNRQTVVSKKISEDLTKMYGKTWAPEKDPLADKIKSSRDSLNSLMMGGMIIDFVKANKNGLVGVYVLNASGKSAMNIDRLESTLKSVSPKMQKTAEGLKLAAYIHGVKSTKIGAVVKNFKLNDPNGKAVSFEQFKGKYVWIDFWASWCGPCKQAFPHMRDLYAKYKDNNFEILGISTDTKTEPWLKALDAIKNPWPQVWDNKNVMSEFAVTAFPTSFLIDPTGKIILREVGYEPNGESAMDKKLEELFGGKKAVSDAL